MAPNTPPYKLSSYGEVAAWHTRAPELVAWADAQLVNRRDAWGEYRPLEEVGKEYVKRDGTIGKLGEQQTRKGRLTPARIKRHFQAAGRADILGLFPASAGNLSLGGALDIDQHGDDPVRAEMNRLAALHWYGVLVRMGFHPLLTASNGKGGYHLRVLLASSIDAARVFHFLRRLTADHRRAGLDKPPEQFPKQPDVRRCEKGLGNWMRLPGRHHKRDYWSEVWNGSHWLAGHDAIDLVLSLRGDDPSLIPDVPPSVPLPRRTYRACPNDNLSARIARYMARLPNLREGQGRDDVAFRFACFLVRDLAVADCIALDWLRRWDAGNSPPKGDDRLAGIVKSAHAYGQHSIGCGIDSLPKKSVQILPSKRPGHLTLSVRAEVRQ